jgi:tetratricopeptide (TPR) repeat protein
MRKIADITLLVVILFSAIPLFPETAEQMDSRAQAHFDRKEYASAIALWLTILDIDPTNERIQQKVEMIYEVKQKKDVAMQKAKLYFKIAMKIIGDNYEEGKQKAQQAIENYILAYRMDPEDRELQALREDMKRLNDMISAEEERRRLSRALRERNLRLRTQAQKEMADNNFEPALKLWNEILSFLPKDIIAIEGSRTCRLAIENRIKYEKIQQFFEKGKKLFAGKEFALSRLEFVQIINLDPENREAKRYISDIDDELDKIRGYEQRKLQAEDFYNSGKNSIKTYNFDQAVEDFESVLALVGEYKDTRELLKSVERLRKEFEEKERQKKLALINQTFQDGIIAFTGADYRTAIAHFSKTLSLDSRNDQAREYLRRSKDALEELAEEEVDRFSPYFDIVNSLIIAGKGLYNRENYAESRKKWEQILQLFPKNRIATEFILKCDMKLNPEAYKTFIERILAEGQEEFRKKNYRGALKKFELIQSIDPNYPDINRLITRARGEQERGVVRLDPVDRRELEQHLRMAANYYQAGGERNYRLALEEYRWVTRKDPENVQAVIGVNKIESQLRIGQGQVAAERKRQLTPEQQQLVMKYYNSGISYYTNNNIEKAVEEWRKVLAIDPTHVKAKNNIKKSLAFLGR